MITTRIAHVVPDFRATRSLVLGSIFAVGLLASFGSVAKAAPAVVDQYTEQVPSPGGEKSPGGSNQPDRPGGSNQPDRGDDGQTTGGGSSTGGSAGSGGGGESQGSGTTAGTAVPNGSLGSKSASGENEDTAGARAATAGARAADRSPAASASTRAGSSKSASSVVDDIVEEGGNGMGILFPLILVGSLIAAGAIFFNRRQGGTNSGGPSVN